MTALSETEAALSSSSKYVAYPEYKDSGVGFLGSVPKSWTVGRYKFCSERVVVGIAEAATHAYADTGVPIIRSTNIREKGLDLNGLLFIKESFAAQNESKYLYENDVITVRTGFPGISSVVPALLDKSQCFTNLISTPRKEFVPQFLTYFLNSNSGKSYFDLLGWGSAQKNISVPILQNFPLAYPEHEEQKTIVKFLNHETVQIDTLIDKQQQLIKLLKEKRQAVISHAVTKGLNPQAPMKDSGVEWLGKVPEHWVVTRAKYVSKIFVPQRNKPDLNDTHGIAWATMEDMKQQYISDTSMYVSPKSALAAGSKKLKAGSVIASCVGNFGVTSINKVDVIINQQLQAFKPVNIRAEYLQSIVALSKQYFELIGTAATLVYVNQEGFENLPVLVPPEKEQNEICDYVLRKSTSFDLLIEKSVIQTSLLKERRTALISAAVTGKIDVRHFTLKEGQASANQEVQQQGVD